MLQNFAWVDAKDSMENRIKGSLSKANDGQRWGSVLFKGLNVELSQALHPEEVEWWQFNSEIVSPRLLRQPETFTQLLAAFRCLLDNTSHVYAAQESGAETIENLNPEIG